MYVSIDDLTSVEIGLVWASMSQPTTAHPLPQQAHVVHDDIIVIAIPMMSSCPLDFMYKDMLYLLLQKKMPSKLKIESQVVNSEPT